MLRRYGPIGHICDQGGAGVAKLAHMTNVQAVMNRPHHAPTSARSHVLAVDDDPVIREAISDYLGQHDFRITAVADGRAMQAVLAQDVVDLVVLDLKLRDEDGMALASRLREESAIPIIMLTGRREEADRVMGLELAADDYLTKPFSPRELLARIRAVLRRRRPDLQQGRPEGIRAYRFDGWELNLNTRRLKAPDGRTVRLSNMEFSLLVVLLGAANRILSRDQLLDMSRLHGDDVYNRSVNTQILRLRRRLETDPAKPRYICTERGAGYVFNARVDIIY
jgi:two-component system OmpR family response regulator